MKALLAPYNGTMIKVRFQSLKSWMLFIMPLLVTVMLAIDPGTARQAAEQTLNLWWAHVVPPLFVGLTAASLTASIDHPLARRLSPILWSLFSLPYVGAFLLHDRLQTRQMAASQVESGLLYVNVWNPWLWDHPSQMIRFDGCLLVVATIICPTLPPPIAPIRFGRRSLLDSLNWTTWIGAAMVFTRTITAWAPASWITGLDPLTAHWTSSSPPWTWGAIGIGGLVGIIPIAWYRHRMGLSNQRWIIWRVLQAFAAWILYRLLFG